MMSAAIGPLFLPRCPATVAGGVGTPVVDAVECQSAWGFAHVGEEIDEIEPAVAYGDATTTVVPPTFMARVGASSYHIRPDVIRGRLAFSGGLSVPQAASNGDASFVASATDGVSCLQIADYRVAFRSAVADAAPSCISHFCREDGQRGQKTEAQSSDIVEFRHVDSSNHYSTRRAA